MVGTGGGVDGGGGGVGGIGGGVGMEFPLASIRLDQSIYSLNEYECVQLDGRIRTTE